MVSFSYQNSNKVFIFKQKFTQSLKWIVGLALIITGTSYAYFTATATSNEQVVESGTLRLTYETGQDINALSIIPTEESSASIHQFTVENTGSLYTDYNISLIDINLSKEGTPTFSSNLKWALYSTNENYSEESLVKSGDFSSLSGYVSGDDTLVIKTNQNLSSGAKQSYVFKVWLQEINIPQNEDQNLSLTMKIQVDTLDRQEAVSRQSVMVARQSWNSKETFYQYSSSITKIVFQNKMSPIETTTSWDISTDSNGNCMAYLVPNVEDSSSTYTLYIQGNDLIYISSGYCLFGSFVNLNTIEGMEYVDTSQVTTMESMFLNCSSLMSLDVSNFNTSKVITMSQMFSGCEKLTSLNLSNFDTSIVSTMSWLFRDCRSLTNLDFRNATFTTVTSYSPMFESVPSTIQVIVKDSTAQAWIQDKLGRGVGTVIISPTV